MKFNYLGVNKDTPGSVILALLITAIIIGVIIWIL